MKYNFDKITNRNQTDSLKWEVNYKLKPVRSDDGILSMWVADMDFPCAEPIVEALKKRAAHPIYGYTMYKEDILSGSLKQWLWEKHEWNVKKEDIFYAPGVVAAINYLINGLTEKDDGIIIQQPVYYPFKKIIQNNGRRVINNPLVENDGYYEMNFADLEMKASEKRTTMMILCSPHNPVGRVWSKEELIRTSEICRRHGVLIVSDEIHGDLVRNGVKFIPVSKVGDSDNIITCTAPSKSFNLPGLMMSSTIIHNEKYKNIWKKEAYGKSGLSLPNSFAVEAFKAAYLSGEEWLKQVTAYIEENLIWLKKFIEKHMPQVGYRIPDGTYLAWLDFGRYYSGNDMRLAGVLEKEVGVLVDPGSIFGREGRGYLRINVACPRQNLEEAMNRIKNAVCNQSL